MKFSFIIFRSAIYVPLFILFFGWIAWQARGLDASIGFLLPAWLKWPGIILMTAGGLLAIICILEFIFRGKGTPAPFDPPREFVASGPYAYVRNPMYIGGLVLLTGFGFYLLSFSVLLLVILLFLVVNMFVIFYEEPTLERLFSKSYSDYKRKVHRWMPRFRKYTAQPAANH